MSLASDAEAALQSAPGPTPWYADAKLDREGVPLQWEHPNGEGLSGLTYLKFADSVLAIFDFQCYVVPAGPDRILVWNAEGEKAFAFRLFNTRTFDTIAGPDAAARSMRYAEKRMVWHGGLLAETIIPTDINDGLCEWVFPEPFAIFDELLVLAHSTAFGRTSNGFDKSNSALWIVRPKASRIDVFPQDWFNDGQFDFGWVWSQKVAREPRSDEIVGWGGRLGIYVLDASHRGVKSWLTKPGSLD